MELKKANRIAYAQAIIAFFVNTALFVGKLWVGLATGSLALVADAWHTMSDSVSSVVVVCSVMFSNKPADEKHPFGHGRVEAFASMLIGIFLIIVAYEFAKEAVERLMNGEGASYGFWAFFVMGLSVLLKEILTQYSFWAYRKTGYGSLKADAWHHRSDSLGSVAVLVGMIFGNYFWWMDGVLSLVIAGIIFYVAYDLIKEEVDKLLGENPCKETVKKLHELADKCAGMEVFAHHFHLHRYGRHVEVTFHVRLPKNMSLQEANEVCVKIKKCVLAEMQMEVTVYPELLLEKK